MWVEECVLGYGMGMACLGVFWWVCFLALHFGFWVGLLWEFGARGVICIGCSVGVINGMFCSPAFVSAYQVLTVMLS